PRSLNYGRLISSGQSICYQFSRLKSSLKFSTTHADPSTEIENGDVIVILFCLAKYL
ncbi:hypothetical protein M413DRAFT_443141, partial [Hebeloma cylindrosporum]